MIIPTPAPRPENENLKPPSVMETEAIQENTIVHIIVSIHVRTMVCHEVLILRIRITALQNPIRTDKTIINPYGDQAKTGISICILEMLYQIPKDQLQDEDPMKSLHDDNAIIKNIRATAK